MIVYQCHWWFLSCMNRLADGLAQGEVIAQARIHAAAVAEAAGLAHVPRQIQQHPQHQDHQQQSQQNPQPAAVLPLKRQPLGAAVLHPPLAASQPPPAAPQPAPAASQLLPAASQSWPYPSAVGSGSLRTPARKSLNMSDAGEGEVEDLQGRAGSIGTGPAGSYPYGQPASGLAGAGILRAPGMGRGPADDAHLHVQVN